MSAKSDPQSENPESHDVPAASNGTGEVWMHPLPGRRRGRPPKMSPQELLDRIRRLAESRGGLFRVHERNTSLYARARRSFGSWSAAVVAAGIDYRETLNGARRRSVKTRRRRTRRPVQP
jgi:hypothetical protein